MSCWQQLILHLVSRCIAGVVIIDIWYTCYLIRDLFLDNAHVNMVT